MSDNPLACRIRAALAGLPVTEQRMFGGICFMLSGNMLACASERGLLVRVGKEAQPAVLARPHARTMEMRGRVMEGYVFVSEEGTAGDENLRSWLALAQAFVAALPEKAPGETGRKRKRAK